MTLTPQTFKQALESLPAAEHYRVAYSGGRDSHVLLHLLAGLVVAGEPSRVSAIHVDHGLQADSGIWRGHAQAVCAQLGIPCTTVDLALRPTAGASPEAEAREARYRALRQLVEPGDMLLTAHHQDDQAETVLQQLLRGAGPAGLAAMPRVATFGAGMLGRPLLEQSAEALTDYALRHGLHWVEDPSNADLRFDRNYLRHQVMPLLRTRWPAMARTISRSAGHCAEAQRLVDGLAADDLAQLRVPEDGTLRLSGLLALARPRARAVVRAWVKAAGLPTPASAHLDRLLSEMGAAAADRNPLVHWPGAEVRRFRDRLYIMPPLQPLAADCRLAWDGVHPLALPPGTGWLRARRGTGGVAAEVWRRGGLEVRFDTGVDRVRIAGRRHSTALKKLYQQRAIPTWMRPRAPLVYQGERLVAVADLCICEEFAAAEGEEGVQLTWQSPHDGSGIGGNPLQRA